MLELEQLPLLDCFLLKPSVFTDNRGSFYESYNHQRFRETTGLDINFVQDNQSTSKKGVLRGLHFQKGKHAQAKLVRCLLGEILDVVVDLRKDSPTYKQHCKVNLSQHNHFQLFVPAGFAHGFLTLSENSLFAYKCDQYYNKEADSGIIWNDPNLNIDWNFPSEELILSEKDANLPTFESLYS
ncbi:MAG TPA: dTDP-4-dehydrorhamnose 3,5-epimerase [Salinimicrobium sp.]|nr:dTDP-4-dehydrorhamnose 3,5-epimerase [Salinimicrobium sp.]